MVAQLKKPILRRPRFAHRRCTAVNGSATPGRLLIPGLSKDVPLKILEDGGKEDRAIFLLEELGLLNAKSRADDAAGFIRLALDNMERMTGCFAGAARNCEAVFLLDGLSESDDSVEGPHFGLKVEDPHVVCLSGIRAALGRVESPLARWFMMNLSGPYVFGPMHCHQMQTDRSAQAIYDCGQLGIHTTLGFPNRLSRSTTSCVRSAVDPNG